MRFEDLEIWKKTEILVLDMYAVCRHIKDYGFKDQLQRASMSIANNISEGYERGSTKEKQRFLRIAKGSCGEVRNIIYFGFKLGYISQQQYDISYSQCISLSRMIYSFIKKIE